MDTTTSIHIEHLQGKGFPLVILHGWGQNSSHLKKLAESLSPYVDPYLIDLPGFGKSKPPKGVWSAYDYAVQLFSKLQEKNIYQFDLVGHSFGGKVALCMAKNFPHSVRKLVLMAPSGLKAKASLKKKLKLYAIKISGRCIKKYDYVFNKSLYQDYFIPQFGSRDYLSSDDIMRKVLVKSVNEDLKEDFSMIKHPALILWGEKDTDTPYEMGIRLHQLLKNSKLITFPHHGHQLCQDVSSHLMSYHMRDFLKSHQMPK